MKNNSVNGAMLITINRVINDVILNDNNNNNVNISQKTTYYLRICFVCFDYGGMIIISQRSSPEIIRY